MIGSLRGKVIEIHASYVLLEVHDVGYAVRASTQTLSSLHIGDDIFVYVYDHVREDAREAFGFLLWDERELFTRLLSVSGVGPKVALTILSAGTIEVVRQAILQADLALLTSVPGVGKKTAQKIVLELKGLLVEESGVTSGDAEVISALMSLGYSAQDARAAVRSVSHDITEVSQRMREALKSLATSRT